jgi:hypothetical protein
MHRRARGRLACMQRLIWQQLAAVLQRFPSSLPEIRMVPPFRYDLQGRSRSWESLTIPILPVRNEAFVNGR